MFGTSKKIPESGTAQICSALVLSLIKFAHVKVASPPADAPVITISVTVLFNPILSSN